MLNPAWKQRFRLFANFALISWLVLGTGTIAASIGTPASGEEITTTAFVVIAVPVFFKALSCLISGK